jgi:putative toxin-antitoxin system antitoxin component (TIGR02293 family)
LMGGRKALGRDVRNFGDLNAVVEAGLPAEALDTIRKLLGDGDLNAQLRKALFSDQPGRAASRTIERTARLVASAQAAFGSRSAAREFVLTPHTRLGGMRPIDCVQTELALKQVEHILDSILFGLPA